MAVFEAQQEIACTVEQLFDFLTQTQNVVELSDPKLELQLESAPDVMEHGSRLKFVVHGYGVPQHVVHEITAFERPHRFVEEQVEGPMKRWVHEHLLEAHGNETRIIDKIEFQPPGGLVGLILTERRIRESLERGFQYRREELAARFGAAR